MVAGLESSCSGLVDQVDFRRNLFEEDFVGGVHVDGVVFYHGLWVSLTPFSGRFVAVGIGVEVVTMLLMAQFAGEQPCLFQCLALR
jgi:hypothetical protein